MRTTQRILSPSLSRASTTIRRQSPWALAHAVVLAVKARLELNRLQELDDHQLLDIGLTRHDLMRAGTSTFFEDPIADLAGSARARARRMERPR